MGIDAVSSQDGSSGLSSSLPRLQFRNWSDTNLRGLRLPGG
jgi:hypothetical protein